MGMGNRALARRQAVRRALAALLAAAIGACGQTARDRGPAPAPDASSESDAPACSLSIEPVPIEDPCEALDPTTCCATDGCAYHESHDRCVLYERNCTNVRGRCAIDQRCDMRPSSQIAPSDCQGGSLAWFVRGICVENPRPTLCFDRCAQLRTFAGCCAEPGCAWHDSHGLCVSEELDCTDDPARCGPGLRCELQWYPWGASQRTDCGNEIDFDSGYGQRGVCTPEP
jgi:hypothetical protein